MEVYFHLNSRENCFPYNFFNSRPPWQCCCLLLGFQHFFWFFMETFSFRPYCRKPVQDRAEIHFCAGVVSKEKKKPRRQVSHESEGKTGIPGIPALMEKRCHCLAAEVCTHKLTPQLKAHNMHTPLLGKTAQDASWNTLLAFSSRSTGQTLIL